MGIKKQAINVRAFHLNIMGIGVRRSLNKLYVGYDVLCFSLHKLLFGFENANRLLRIIDKRAVITILRKNGAVIGEDCDIETPLILHNCCNYTNLTISNGCHIGKEVLLDLKAPVVIEDLVTVSMRVTIITHFDVGKSPLKQRHEFRSNAAKTVLKRGSYIGANAIILHGVTIGECAVIAAGAVVVKNVLPYTVVGGIPARVIRKIRM